MLSKLLEYAPTVGKKSHRPGTPGHAASVLHLADRRGGTHTPSESKERQCTISSVLSAEKHFLLMETISENTAAMSVMCRPGSNEGGFPVTPEQFESEILFHASIAPFIKMRETGIISEDDLNTILDILTKKYAPLFVGNIVSK